MPPASASLPGLRVIIGHQIRWPGPISSTTSRMRLREQATSVRQSAESFAPRFTMTFGASQPSRLHDFDPPSGGGGAPGRSGLVAHPGAEPDRAPSVGLQLIRERRTPESGAEQDRVTDDRHGAERTGRRQHDVLAQHDALDVAVGVGRRRDRARTSGAGRRAPSAASERRLGRSARSGFSTDAHDRRHPIRRPAPRSVSVAGADANRVADVRRRSPGHGPAADVEQDSCSGSWQSVSPPARTIRRAPRPRPRSNSRRCLGRRLRPFAVSRSASGRCRASPDVAAWQ